jgi:hypothetical protein
MEKASSSSGRCLTKTEKSAKEREELSTNSKAVFKVTAKSEWTQEKKKTHVISEAVSVVNA